VSLNWWTLLCDVTSDLASKRVTQSTNSRIVEEWSSGRASFAPHRIPHRRQSTMAMSSGTKVSHIGSDPSAETCPAPELPAKVTSHVKPHSRPTKARAPFRFEPQSHSESKPGPVFKTHPPGPRFGQFSRPWPLGFLSLPQSSSPWSHITAASQASKP